MFVISTILVQVIEERHPQSNYAVSYEYYAILGCSPFYDEKDFVVNYRYFLKAGYSVIFLYRRCISYTYAEGQIKIWFSRVSALPRNMLLAH